MSNKVDGESLLENAYQLSTPKENETYYNLLAGDYDSEFASRLGYDVPAAIAAVYNKRATEHDLPIADIGCGTGLVAEALNRAPDVMDGMDISEEMIQLSKQKLLYRALYRVDLTQPLESINNQYGAVLSAGTFTIGHLGPEALGNLLDIVRSEALFVISINKQHYVEQRFEAYVDNLKLKDLIMAVQVVESPIYSKGWHTHANDVVLVLSFRKV